MIKIKDTLHNSKLDSNKFITIDYLGQGSFGTVEKAIYNNSSDKFYAIKTLKITKNSDLTQKDAECEVKMLERISKMMKKPSAFPTFYGYTHSSSSERDEYKLYMDCKNHDLEEFCGQFISFSSFKDLALQLINALAYLETYNMCHRDIKPKNILIEEVASKRLKATLIDFGVSKEFENLEKNTVLSIVVGTKAYLAPELLIALEQERKRKKAKRMHVDCFKADVFSLGLVFLRVVTGKYFEVNADEDYFEEKCQTRVKALLRKFKEKLDVKKEKKYYKEKKFFCDQVKEMLNYDPEARPSFIQLFFWFMDHTDMKKVRNHILVEEGKLFNIKIVDDEEEKKKEEVGMEDETKQVNKTYEIIEHKTDKKFAPIDNAAYDQSRSLIPRPNQYLNSDKLNSLNQNPRKKRERNSEYKSNFYLLFSLIFLRIKR